MNIVENIYERVCQGMGTLDRQQCENGTCLWVVDVINYNNYMC